MIGFGTIISAVTTLGSGLLTAYNKSKDVTIAGYQSAATMAHAQADYMKAVLGHPLSPPSLLCYAVALYYGKSIAFDNVIAFWVFGEAGFTPPIKGETAYAALVILSGMFAGALYRQVRQT